MENHPIPQDITGFQFKLIGNMTVKQFAYIAAGAIVAWFFFFVLPIPFLIKFPISIISLILGASFAFVPIEGRPLDSMVSHFFKALFTPTQYIYQKEGGDLSNITSASQSAPQQALPIQHPAAPFLQQVNQPIQVQPVQQLPNPVQQPVSVSTPSIPQPDLSPEEIAQNEKRLDEEEVELNKQIEEVKTEENAPGETIDANSLHQKTLELEEMLAKTQKEKEELEKELLMLKSQRKEPDLTSNQPIAVSAEPIIQSSEPPQPVAEAPQQAQPQTPEPVAKNTSGMLTPEAPNLITGIVKDPRGNILQNILVEVKDAEENPVRAFKTNNLGQFASATSLSNGRYIVNFEDPKEQHKFDSVTLEALGAPIAPIEVISVDPREELRRELFN